MAARRRRIWEFVETCETAATPLDVASLFFNAAEELGFEQVAIVSRDADPLNPPPHGVAMCRISKSWMQHYSAERYQEIDPRHAKADQCWAPFRWDTPAFRETLEADQRRMLDEMAEAGLVEGVGIPIRSPGALPAVCALYPGDNDIEPEGYMIAHSMAVLAHEAARKLMGASVSAAPRLTPRECASLALVARGKSDWTIGELLDLSEAAAHRLVESAKRKLGVATRVQAVMRAVQAGQLLLSDVVE